MFDSLAIASGELAVTAIASGSSSNTAPVWSDAGPYTAYRDGIIDLTGVYKRQFLAWPWAKVEIRYEDLVSAVKLFDVNRG